MSLKMTDLFVAELNREAVGTRKALERVPEGQNDWRPHPKSMPLAIGSFPDDAQFRIVSVKGEWQGQTLVVTEKVSYQGADGVVTARYTRSGDGKMLTKQTHVSMSVGEFDTRTVYDKQ